MLTFSTMYIGSIKPIDWMDSDVEPSSEVGDVMQPTECKWRIWQGQAEAKNREQARQYRPNEHRDL